MGPKILPEFLVFNLPRGTLMAITSVLATATSGLLAAGRKAAAAADNIVNVNTPGARSARVETTSLVAGPGGGSGVEAQLLADEAAPDLAGAVIDLIQAETAFKASAAVVRAGEEMAREGLDILA